jgi:hypothetical protein
MMASDKTTVGQALATRIGASPRQPSEPESAADHIDSTDDAGIEEVVLQVKEIWNAS